MGQAASAMHAMATYQRYQVQALTQLHKGGCDPGLMHKLRIATDYALHTTKSAAHVLGRTMAT